MRDIFLSYSRSVKPIAKIFVEAFEQKGFSVWWDQKIPPGGTWAEVIEKALKDTKCVVVLWSQSSVKSNWVKKEARYGEKHNALFPAVIDRI